MRSFIKGILAGSLLGALAGVMMKPSRKPALKEWMNMAEESEMGKKTGKMVKGMARSVDRMMK